jgi:hypothetical protein
MPDPADWTIAIDLALREAARCCTVCGKRGTPTRPLTRFDVWVGERLAMATFRCQECYRLDPAGERLHAVMAARYGDGA